MRKPMVTARRVALFEREVKLKLGAAALEVLLDAASVLSEGQRQGARWFGSTMITVDLAKLGDLLRDIDEPATAAQVADLLADDPRARGRARELALVAAAERAGGKLARTAADLRVRALGQVVQIDVDVEGDVVRGAAVRER